MDQHYNTQNLTLSDKIEILKTAKKVSYQWWIDILDCSKSWSRQKVEISFEEILEKLNDKVLFSVILRDDFGKEFSGEIGFTTMEEPSYFLWILISQEYFERIVTQYNLNLK